MVNASFKAKNVRSFQLSFTMGTSSDTTYIKSCLKPGKYIYIYIYIYHSRSLERVNGNIKNAKLSSLSLLFHVIWTSCMVALTLEHSSSTQSHVSSQQDRLFKPQDLILPSESKNILFLGQKEAIENNETPFVFYLKSTHTVISSLN